MLAHCCDITMFDVSVATDTVCECMLHVYRKPDHQQNVHNGRMTDCVCVLLRSSWPNRQADPKPPQARKTGMKMTEHDLYPFDHLTPCHYAPPPPSPPQPGFSMFYLKSKAFGVLCRHRPAWLLCDGRRDDMDGLMMSLRCFLCSPLKLKGTSFLSFVFILLILKVQKQLF